MRRPCMLRCSAYRRFVLGRLGTHRRLCQSSRGRGRMLALVGLIGVLGPLAVAYRGEADLEHIVAAMCGAGIVALTNCREGQTCYRDS